MGRAGVASRSDAEALCSCSTCTGRTALVVGRLLPERGVEALAAVVEACCRRRPAITTTSADARPTSTVFGAPGRYVQGVGAIDDLPQWLDRLGIDQPLLLVDPVAARPSTPRRPSPTPLAPSS